MCRTLNVCFDVMRLMLGRNLAQPLVCNGIRRHTPIASWRERYRTYFRAVGYCRTLELLRKESSQEDLQPVANLLGRIATLESTLGEGYNLARSEAVADEVVDVEVVQLVRANNILGLLCDFTLCGCR